MTHFFCKESGSRDYAVLVCVHIYCMRINAEMNERAKTNVVQCKNACYVSSDFELPFDSTNPPMNIDLLHEYYSG